MGKSKKSKKATGKKSVKVPRKMGSKKLFILGLPPGLTAKEAVAEAKKKGISISANYVQMVRAWPRPSALTEKAKTRPGRAKAVAQLGNGMGKKQFILDHLPKMKAQEIVDLGKKQGMVLTPAYVYTVRAEAKRSRKKGKAKTTAPINDVTVKGDLQMLQRLQATASARLESIAHGEAAKVGVAKGGKESTFKQLAAQIGLVRAQELMSEVLRTTESW